MTQDPFGNLREWGPALELLDELAGSGKLSGCQHGLIRILRYKGNWRLREEALKRIGGIPDPSNKLVAQVLDIIQDDNIYYDARILANNALVELLRNGQNRLPQDFIMKIRKVIEQLCKSPQPPFFQEAINQLDSEIGLPGALQA